MRRITDGAQIKEITEISMKFHASEAIPVIKKVAKALKNGDKKAAFAMNAPKSLRRD